jgi:hypothetical protein
MGRWTPFLMVLWASMLTVALVAFILRADDLIGRTTWFLVMGLSLCVLFVGDVWSVRRARHRNDR